MDPNMCEIMIRIQIPIALANDIDREAHRTRKSIDCMLAEMLVDAWEDHVVNERAKAAMENLGLEPMLGEPSSQPLAANGEQFHPEPGKVVVTGSSLDPFDKPPFVADQNN